jgi:hypothetical protein
MADFVSSRTRGRFRDLSTNSTLDDITRAFQDEGFAPNADSTCLDSSERRTLALHYLEAVNWSDVTVIQAGTINALASVEDELAAAGRVALKPSANDGTHH